MAPGKAASRRTEAAGNGGTAAAAAAQERAPDTPSDPDEAASRVGDANAYLLGGLAGLALALAGGFVWYRRRLP